MNDTALCSKTHEYILELEPNKYEVGITDYAIEQLGDIVFVELPEVGTTFKKNEVFATCPNLSNWVVAQFIFFLIIACKLYIVNYSY